MSFSDMYKKYKDGLLTDYGHLVRIYPSSSAEKDAMWIAVSHDGTAPGTKSFKGNQHVHATFEQAREIRQGIDLVLGEYKDLPELSINNVQSWAENLATEDFKKLLDIVCTESKNRLWE